MLKSGRIRSSDYARLQAFVKQTIAPYKYPRTIEFVDSLPRTETGKLQRFRLRELATRDNPPNERDAERVFNIVMALLVASLYPIFGSEP